ncbi:hypothetical protein GS875_13960, partial [Rhodococcus hoagii]|nr:hypothetical protein [Prescottella equi]
ALSELPQDKRIVLHCKTGIRSAEALAAVRKAGFADAVHLQGGVVAWANQVDRPSRLLNVPTDPISAAFGEPHRNGRLRR